MRSLQRTIADSIVESIEMCSLVEVIKVDVQGGKFFLRQGRGCLKGHCSVYGRLHTLQLTLPHHRRDVICSLIWASQSL
jgi:hypothetical protein